MLTEKEKVDLLSLARVTIEAKLSGRALPIPKQPEGNLLKPCGVFVSLHRTDGRLRGCIGLMESDRPLWQNVQEMAVAASTRDPRFQEVEAFELPDIEIELSVLFPRRVISDMNEIEVGKHGLYVTKGPHRGVLLPQVATEHHWTRDEFLTQTCHKAGLPDDAWTKAGIIIEIFEAEVFGEKSV